MKIKRNIAMSLIKDLIQDEKFKKEMIDLISSLGQVILSIC